MKQSKSGTLGVVLEKKEPAAGKSKGR